MFPGLPSSIAPEPTACCGLHGEVSVDERLILGCQGVRSCVRPPWSFTDSFVPVVATAIHAGHDLRPAVASCTALDDATRLREEDPFTDHLTSVGGSTVVAHRSRFEVDLNRPRG